MRNPHALGCGIVLLLVLLVFVLGAVVPAMTEQMLQMFRQVMP